jgi:hypothetical protein
MATMISSEQRKTSWFNQQYAQDVHTLTCLAAVSSRGFNLSLGLSPAEGASIRQRLSEQNLVNKHDAYQPNNQTTANERSHQEEEHQEATRRKPPGGSHQEVEHQEEEHRQQGFKPETPTYFMLATCVPPL